jgi:hypothetical protein
MAKEGKSKPGVWVTTYLNVEAVNEKPQSQIQWLKKVKTIHSLLERVNFLYFNCNDLGQCELSQPGTTDYFLNVILCDFICSLITVA